MRRMARRMAAVWLLLASRIAASAQGAFPEEAARPGHLTNRGRFDEVIAQATERMSRAGTPDPALRYLRGNAEWKIVTTPGGARRARC